MNLTHLKSLSDDDLLARLSDAVNDSRRVEAQLVAHIAEVDARRLYAREAWPSMHAYCTGALHLSDAEAYFRITAARALRRFPVLLAMLEDGRIHLSGIEVLAPHLTEANCDELLARASRKSKRDLKELVAEIAPKPDVPPVVRKLPERGRTDATPMNEPSLEKAHGLTVPQTTPSGRSSSLSSSASPEPDRRKRVEPLSPGRYKVQFTASAELRDKLERLSKLMPDGDLAGVIEAAVTEKLERLEAKRYGKVKKPRKALEDADTAPGPRGIAAPVRRFVWDRDGGQCTFVASDGRRCPERHRLEFHHDDPHGLGGDRSAENIRLLCRQHNLYRAELDYGKETMDPYRRSADRVGEPVPTFGLRPERERAAPSSRQPLLVRMSALRRIRISTCPVSTVRPRCTSLTVMEYCPSSSKVCSALNAR